MYKKSSVTLVAITCLLFTLAVTAQVPRPGVITAPDSVADLTAGYKNGLIVEIFDMANVRDPAVAPISSTAANRFAAGVPPFTGSSLLGQINAVSSSQPKSAGIKWSGFIMTKDAGTHTFRLRATAGAENTNCIASIAVNNKAQAPAKFSQNQSSSIDFELNLTTGLTPLSIWINCDGEQASQTQISEASIKLALESRAPRQRALTEISANAYFFKP
jgi:hypothetical protein